MSEKVTEEWLRSCGFKFEHGEKEGEAKMWIRWLATACVDREPRAMVSCSDLGIELSEGHLSAEGWKESWFCWIRADYAGRYSRFVHIRHVKFQKEVVQLIEAMTGREFKPDDCMYGSFHSPETAERLRAESKRLDHRLAKHWGDRVDQELKIDPDDRQLRRP